MSIKEHALLVSLSVSKPQMTAKDQKATADAEAANNAHGAGQYRKDLYPKALVQPILTVESAARAYLESTTYMWDRGAHLLPNTRFMAVADRMGKFELEFNQCVTAFLNNWSNVMMQAQQAQGALFDASAYPDLSDLRSEFRFRVIYRPVTDMGDFRVKMQEDELDLLRAQVEQATKESMDNMLKEPLQRLREVVAKLHSVTQKPERKVLNKRNGYEETRPPIFRDSVIENVCEELALLQEFAAVLPDDIITVANAMTDALVPANVLRDNPEDRKAVGDKTAALLATIDNMLED